MIIPLIEVHLVEKVFSHEQKRQIIQRLTDAMVSIEGENMRGVTWVKISEVTSGECDACVSYVMQSTLRYSNHVSWIRAKGLPINLPLELTFGYDVYFAKAQVSVRPDPGASSVSRFRDGVAAGGLLSGH